MNMYNLDQVASQTGKSPYIIKEWFNILEGTYDYYFQIKNKTPVYTERDINVAKFIAKKRDDGWSYDKIFEQIKHTYSLKTRSEVQKESKIINNYIYNLGRDPEELFYEIAQDSEIIQTFKYHSLRVMFLASALAKRVDCYDEDLRLAALLHDIGKVGISKSILLKTEKLTDLEYTIIQSHSHIGNVIVRQHLGLTRAAQFIRDHHERWDGKGYPRRLLGDEISIQGRIISICDAYDTMTVDRRIYKQDILTHEEALQELERCAWKQFDGHLVQKFINIMNEVTIPTYMLPK